MNAIKAILLVLITILFERKSGLSQSTPRPRLSTLPVAPVLAKKFDTFITTTDFNGRPFQTLYPDAEGSPYFLEEFNYANLLLNKGATYQRVKVRLDLVSHELHLINGAGNEIVSENGLVRKVEMIDSVTGLVHYRFITGCPAIDQQGGNEFYQVLSDGRLQLLLYTKKEFVEEKNTMSGEIRHLFKERSELYTLRDGVITKLKRDKDAVLALMTDKQAEVEAWLKARKMNYKSNGLLANLFDYYNSLLKPF